MNKSILFYYHHFGGFGHGMRVYSLCKAIKELRPDYGLLVVNSGVPQPELGIDRYAKVINLPPFKAKNGLFSGLSSTEDINIAFRKRERLLKIIADRFKPDIAIFEHFPFGRDSIESEITKFINLLHREKTLIYSSVRDIVLQHTSAGKLRQRLQLFHGIFVHSEKEFGFKTSFYQPKELKKKVIFTGRVFPVTEEKLIAKGVIIDELKCGNKKLISISIGGGIDGLDIIEEMIRIKSKIDKQIETFYLICTGTSLSDGHLKKLKQQVKNKSDIAVREFIPDFTSYVNASDLYVSMGGYNSINNALFTGKKTLIFPRRYDNEQIVRARCFKKFVSICHGQGFSKKLPSRITSILKKSSSAEEYRGNLRGAAKTARLLDRVLNLNYIKIRLTTKCNCCCDMCSWRKITEKLSFPAIKNVIDRAKLLNVKTIGFTGGEPTLHPDFRKLIKYTKKQGFFVSVSTNGTFLNEDLIHLSKFSDLVDFSINSHKPELDDKIKGRVGASKCAIDAIMGLNNQNRNIKIHINVTVRPDNLENIHKIVSFLSKHITSVSFTLADSSKGNLEYLRFNRTQLLYFYFNEVPLILKECLKNNIQVKFFPFYKDLQNFSTRQKLERLLRNKRYYFSIFKTIFIPNPALFCVRAKTGLRINSNGEISPCCYLDDYPINLGNILKSDLLDIVSSNKYSNFIFSNNENINFCKRCMAGYKMYPKLFK